MKTVLKILNYIRYITCLLIVLAIAFITAPLTVFFGWKGVWVLWIANEEGCSLAEARKILQEGKKYHVTNVSYHTGSQNLFPKTSSAIGEDEINSPAYKHLPFNIHHRH